MNTEVWISCKTRLPESDVVVMTKIDDEKGVKNIQTLKIGSHGLWWLPDDSMYIYYNPTHWHPL